MLDIYEYYTGKQICRLNTNELTFSAWCDIYGYLPHHKTSKGWVVIK